MAPTELLLPSSSNFERVRMLVTSATYTIRPALLDEFRFGYTDDHFGGSNPFKGQAFSNSLGLDNIQQNMPHTLVAHRPPCRCSGSSEPLSLEIAIGLLIVFRIPLRQAALDDPQEIDIQRLFVRFRYDFGR